MLNFELGSYITIWHNLPISRLFPLKDHSTPTNMHAYIAYAYCPAEHVSGCCCVCVVSVNMQIVSALALEYPTTS